MAADIAAIAAPAVPLVVAATLSGRPGPWIGLLLVNALPKLAVHLRGRALRANVAIAADTATLVLAILLCGQVGLFACAWVAVLSRRTVDRRLLGLSILAAVTAGGVSKFGGSPQLLDANLLEILGSLAALVQLGSITTGGSIEPVAALPIRPVADQLDAHALAVLSHELRTPLNAIIGFAGLLRTLRNEAGIAARRDDYARIIESSGQHMLGVLEEAVGGAHVAQPGRHGPALSAIDLESSVAECLDLLTPLAAANAVTLELRHGAHPHRAIGEARALRQILLNLVANAIKFSSAGGSVKVSVHRRGNGRLEIAVADRGMGIPPSELTSIGRPYNRGAEALARQIEGSGLGLAISRQLAEQLGGCLDLESRTGAGTTARVQLREHAPSVPGRGPKRRTRLARPARSGTEVNPMLAMSGP